MKLNVALPEIVEGKRDISELEMLLGANASDSYSDNKAIRGLHRLGGLLLSSPDRLKDKQFTDRVVALVQEIEMLDEE